MSEAVPTSEDTGKLVKAIESLISKHGDERGAIKTLLDENLEYRQQLRDLKKELKEANGKAPAEGAIVLSGDDLKAYEAYQALGKPEELTDKLKKADESLQRLTELETAQTFADAAKIAGANEKALRKLYGEEKLVTKKVGDEDKVFVVTDDKETELSEHVKEHNPEFENSIFGLEAPEQPASRFPIQNPVRRPAQSGATLDQIKQKKARSGAYTI